jgi:hypothetical protein
MATVIESDLNRYEVVKVLNPDGQVLNVAFGTSPTAPTSTALDAFGRQRVSNPLTLFDSSHRYGDNGLWATSTATGGAATFNTNQGLVDLTVNSTSGSKVHRETLKVFAYEPGKSLLILNTFVFNAAKAGLRQRVGYFGASNGIYLEQDGTDIYFVKRSLVTGSVVNTRVAKADWNVDRLDGTGPSKLTLDLSKAQILFTDIEWLGVGTVRIGFIIDGKFIHCHSFQHANVISSTYITTACLPLRYEIENTAGTTGSSTLKQICSTVISEGGYELRGAQQSVQLPIASPRDLTNASTDYPVISLRLKTSPDRLDAIVILSALSFMGITNNANYRWEIVQGSTTTGGTWVSAGVDSSVEYNITGTSVTGGRIVASGFTNGSNQGSFPVDISKESLFTFQLERNSFTSTPYELTLLAETNSAGADVLASLDWEEVSR